MMVCTIALIISFSLDIVHLQNNSVKSVEREYTTEERLANLRPVAAEQSTGPTWLIMKAKSGYIVVEDSNGKIVHETNINLSDVPREVKIKILNGHKVNNIYEVYDFLEAYSS